MKDLMKTLAVVGVYIIALKISEREGHRLSDSILVGLTGGLLVYISKQEA